MDRRDFLKAMAVAGATAAIDLGGAGKVMAQNGASAEKLVAVMNGTPVQMLDRALTELGGIGQFVSRGQKVVVKPNIGWNRTPELAGNTNPDLVGALVERCLSAGASEVSVFDNTCDQWVACYDNSGIKAAVERAGGRMVPANDESLFVEVALPNGAALKSTKIHRVLVECDTWFNVPILKHHGGAKMTAALKNYLGIVWNRQIIHSTDLQQCIADLNTWSKKPALHIVDAYRVLARNGPQGRSAEDVVEVKALIASKDPVAADAAALAMFNQITPTTLEDASHILNAQALRLGTTNLSGSNVQRIRL